MSWPILLWIAAASISATQENFDFDRLKGDDWEAYAQELKARGPSVLTPLFDYARYGERTLQDRVREVAKSFGPKAAPAYLYDLRLGRGTGLFGEIGLANMGEGAVPIIAEFMMSGANLYAKEAARYALHLNVIRTPATRAGRRALAEAGAHLLRLGGLWEVDLGESLVFMSYEMAFPELDKLIIDKNQAVSGRAFKAVAELDASRCWETMGKGLRLGIPKTRLRIARGAAYTLAARVAPKTGITLLSKFRTDRSPSVRAAIRTSLAKLRKMPEPRPKGRV